MAEEKKNEASSSYAPAADCVEGRVSSRPDAALVLYGAFASSGLKSCPGVYDPEEQRKVAAEDPIRNLRFDGPPTWRSPLRRQ